jgi:carbamoyltransferase
MINGTMVILGIGFVDHEASAALVIDGVLKSGIARERLTRIKKDGKMRGTKRIDPSLSIAYCLSHNGLQLEDVDLVAWNHVDHEPESQVLETLAREGSVDLSGIPRIVLPHHFAHACTAFFLSPFEEAAILVADGSGGPLDALVSYCEGPERDSLINGEVLVQNLRPDLAAYAREQESFYAFDGGRWRSLRKIAGDFAGIGAQYGLASELLFGDCLHSGKTMGLAPYGTPHERDLFLGDIGPEGLPTFRSIHPIERDQIEEEIGAFLKAHGPQVAYETPLIANFAASIQCEAERALLSLAQWLQRTTGARTLCLSGGVALNCVANSLIARDSGFEHVFVPPAPGDDGIALGCALFGAASRGCLRRGVASAFLGHGHAHEQSVICAEGFAPVPLERQSFEDAIAERLAAGAVVAWYQGGAEFGPRALGHRSFLVDPRRADMVGHLNQVVKERESFRPFAPVVLEDSVLDYFTRWHPSTYMSFVADVRPDKRAVVPAVTHADGSARYQVLGREDNPELERLIRAFQRRTGIPMLLNTSLNRAGEPIVETPVEAARCAVASSADYLALDCHLYRALASRL